MILNVYATRNKKSGQFSARIDLQVFDEKQAIENYSVAKLEATKEMQVLYDELELYRLGSYDTETGKLVPVDPIFLLDLAAVKYHGRKEEATQSV